MMKRFTLVDWLWLALALVPGLLLGIATAGAAQPINIIVTGVETNPTPCCCSASLLQCEHVYWKCVQLDVMGKQRNPVGTATRIAVSNDIIIAASPFLGGITNPAWSVNFP